MREELYNEFHKRVEKLTGDEWCPYPSESFMKAIITTDDANAKKLIEHRRTLLFPSFLSGEPQQEEINRILI